ncbi:putative lipid II flippase FtsW [Lancefieldella parvula]|uniref:putative lipid II flippase FtsW n=1 Tax=Lancefieldella parvula TaxID=1382 RepID=UPI0028D1B1CF|nr:putative lipid II flippase FtsW [Lancefieldella parvula]
MATSRNRTGERAQQPRTSRQKSSEGSQAKGRFGAIPERFMQPRLVLLVSTAILVCFGLVMIYSASSISAMTSEDMGYNPFYYVQRQLGFAAAGVALAFIVSRIDYRAVVRNLQVPIWVVTIGMLAIIFTPIAGADAYGATRWISIGPFSFQPSEFAKITILISVSYLAQQYFIDQTIDQMEFFKKFAIAALAPLLLILAQPDKGSTLIIVGTLLVIGYLADVDRRVLATIAVAGFIGFAFLSLKDDYSRARVVTMFNPWADYYGAGYQLAQGFYAFGSGGIFGVGFGFSRQKYSYLPMAHNDFIFAVIGEELGFIGVLGLLVVFGALVWAGFKIARYAPDLTGRLIAAGCTSMFIIQAFVNIGGVLGLLPLSGKPLPFISYGGSTIMSSILMVGLLMSVSRQSRLPETEYDRQRASWSIAEEQDTFDAPGFAGLTMVDGGVGVGMPLPRSPRPKSSAQSSARPSRGVLRSRDDDAPQGRITTDASGRRRIDLGPSASDRLRGSNTRPRR